MILVIAIGIASLDQIFIVRMVRRLVRRLVLGSCMVQIQRQGKMPPRHSVNGCLRVSHGFMLRATREIGSPTVAVVHDIVLGTVPSWITEGIGWIKPPIRTSEDRPVSERHLECKVPLILPKNEVTKQQPRGQTQQVGWYSSGFRSK